MRILKPLLKIIIWAAIIFALYYWVIFPWFAPKVKVVHMIDPDSLIVLEGKDLKNVQLIGVDAPEIAGPYNKHECFEAEAERLAAAYLKTDREVVLERDDKLGDKDIFLRDLRYVKLADGSLLNEKLLLDGLAKEFHPEGTEYKMQERFLEAESIARESKKGIWAECEGEF